MYDVISIYVYCYRNDFTHVHSLLELRQKLQTFVRQQKLQLPQLLTRFHVTTQLLELKRGQKMQP